LSRVTGCRSVAVARRDGLLIVHHLAPGTDPIAMAKIGVAAVRAVRRIAERLEQGEFEQAVIKCADGTILAAEAGSDAVLIALYEREADLSLAGFRIRTTTQAIDETLSKA
jgi:predicted regulator of Ras-like GTPase activity (Roadblock/LC7/MglB family)